METPHPFNVSDWPAWRAHWLPRWSKQAEARWRSSEARGLPERDVKLLAALYVDHVVGGSDWRRIQFPPVDPRPPLHPSKRHLGLSPWTTLVRRITVDIRPGGRAVLQSPNIPYRVEIQWAASGTARDPGRFRPTSVTIAGSIRVGSWPDLDAYLAAFLLAWNALEPNARTFKGAPPLTPSPGHRPPRSFYSRVVRRYDTLVAHGVSDPAAQLAREIGKNRSTVKSWVRRGRIYLSREEGDSK